MILLIQWTNARVKHESERDADDLHKFEDENFAQPRSVRMLNLLAAHEGSGARFSEANLMANTTESLH